MDLTHITFSHNVYLRLNLTHLRRACKGYSTKWTFCWSVVKNASVFLNILTRCLFFFSPSVLFGQFVLFQTSLNDVVDIYDGPTQQSSLLSSLSGSHSGKAQTITALPELKTECVVNIHLRP